jgi:hypothetical protein
MREQQLEMTNDNQVQAPNSIFSLYSIQFIPGLFSTTFNSSDNVE